MAEISEIQFSISELSYYYDQMVQADLLELEIETQDGKMVLKRTSKESLPSHPFRRRKTDFLEKEDPPVSSSHQTISSPLNGVFYRASSPQSAPFVKEGDLANPGSTLCIVEAMKVMNEIKTESRCKIIKIIAENGKPVSKGQGLFLIEP